MREGKKTKLKKEEEEEEGYDSDSSSAFEDEPFEHDPIIIKQSSVVADVPEIMVEDCQ